MKIRAVIVDVYNTLLEVGPAPASADALWRALFEEMLGTAPPVSATEFSVLTGQVTACHHAAAKSQGIQWPEIQWSSVVLEALPGLARLTAPKLEDFLFRQTQLGRTLRLADGAEECVRHLHDQGLLLGIASNAQAYTLRELAAACAGTELNLSLFDREMRFWSFENGFSKPDAHVFRILTARLEARGIRPAETLMVGDRLDNDLEPAQAQGWQTWQLGPLKQDSPSGGWRELSAWLMQTQ